MSRYLIKTLSCGSHLSCDHQCLCDKHSSWEMEVLIFFSISGGKKVLFRIPSPLWLYLLCSPCCAGIGLAASELLCAEPEFSGIPTCWELSETWDCLFFSPSLPPCEYCSLSPCSPAGLSWCSGHRSRPAGRGRGTLTEDVCSRDTDRLLGTRPRFSSFYFFAECNLHTC